MSCAFIHKIVIYYVRLKWRLHCKLARLKAGRDFMLKKWNELSLVVRIFIGLVIGTVLGIACPQFTVISILGTLFVGALKAIAPILVFVLVMSAISNAQGKIGSRFKTVIFLYMLSTLLAAVVAVAACYIFPVTMVLESAAEGSAPEGLAEVLKNLLSKAVANPVSALSEANYLAVLFWAVIFGIALKKHELKSAINVISDFSGMVSQAVRWVIQFAPFGILGLVFSSVAENGIGIFITYRDLLIELVGCMLLVALVIDPFVAFLYLRRNPYPLVLKCLRESGLTAFFTRSSAANIPVNMDLCERLGLDPDFYSVSIPLGATINMDGAAITITVMTLSVCHTLGISVDIPTAILLSVLSTLAACGASGVAGGSLLLIPMACSLFGVSNDIAMEAVAVGFIIGVVQDSVETALNSSGDVMFAATAEYHDRAKNGKPVHFLGKEEE